MLASVLVPLISVMMRKQRPIVSHHLQRLQPGLRGRELRRAVQKSYQSYARYYIETFRLPALNAKKFKQELKLPGLNIFKAAWRVAKE